MIRHPLAVLRVGLQPGAGQMLMLVATVVVRPIIPVVVAAAVVLLAAMRAALLGVRGGLVTIQPLKMVAPAFVMAPVVAVDRKPQAALAAQAGRGLPQARPVLVQRTQEVVEAVLVMPLIVPLEAVAS